MIRYAHQERVSPWAAGGDTSEENLAPLRRFHHRIKGEARWSHEFEPDGGGVWASPMKRRYRRAPTPP